MGKHGRGVLCYEISSPCEESVRSGDRRRDIIMN